MVHAQPPESPRARKVPRGRPSRKRKPGPGPEPVSPTSAARWRANRRAHKSARTQYNPCPGTAVPATCVPLLMVTVDICMNRTNGMILLDADEEEAWEAQLRIGTGIRSGPKAPDKAGESISNENSVFDDMG